MVKSIPQKNINSGRAIVANCLLRQLGAAELGASDFTLKIAIDFLSQ